MKAFNMALTWDVLLTTLIAGLSIFALIKTLFWAGQYYAYLIKLLKIPSEPRHWFYGNYHLFERFTGRDLIVDFMPKRISRFPRIIGIWGYFNTWCDIMVYHPETVKVIMQSSEPKDRDYRDVKPWIGDGLILSHGKHWARNRKLLTPAFHFDVLKSYFQIYNEAAEKFLKRIGEESNGTKSIGIFKPVSKCTLNILLRCAFSDNSDVQSQSDSNEYISAVQQILSLLDERQTLPKYSFLPFWLYKLTPHGKKFQNLANYIRGMAKDVTDKRRKILTSGKHVETRKHIDFLDILLSARDSEGNGMSDPDILDEVSTFMFAGHDTTASGTSWTLYSLAKWSEHQEKVYEEIEEFMQGRDNQNIDGKDLEHFKYLSLCIKETLRYHSPAPIIGRGLTKDLTVDGFVIPRGTAVGLSLYTLHHNPEVWERHMEFDPMRFSSENSKDRHPFAFVPFSAGQRNCIGQNFAMHEMKTLLIRILSKFRVELDPDHVPEYQAIAVMKAENDIKLKFIPRQSVPY